MKKLITGCLLAISVLLVSCFSHFSKSREDSTFKTIQIGSQEWMAENLDVIHFRNGDTIFEANSYEEWEQATIKAIPAWCYYNNDPENGKKYGKLYNWWAVSDPRGLAPEGWHIPSDEEWIELAEYLGGIDIAGAKMKSETGWKDNGNGNNQSGFSGLPGGYRSHERPGFLGGPFYEEGLSAHFWSTTRYLVDNVWSRNLSSQNSNLGKKSYVRTAGLSVRCIKD